MGMDTEIRVSVEIDPGVCLVEKWIWYAFIGCLKSVCCVCVCVWGGGGRSKGACLLRV